MRKIMSTWHKLRQHDKNYVIMALNQKNNENSDFSHPQNVKKMYYLLMQHAFHFSKNDVKMAKLREITSYWRQI